MKKTTTKIFDVEEYGGKQVAIVDGKIIAAGTDPVEVIEAATREVPHIAPQDILLISVPPPPRVIYYWSHHYVRSRWYTGEQKIFGTLPKRRSKGYARSFMPAS